MKRLSLAIGSVIGLIGAFARANGPRQLRILVAAYVEFVRNIPLLLIIYFVYFGLPLIGISILDKQHCYGPALALKLLDLCKRGLDEYFVVLASVK